MVVVVVVDQAGQVRLATLVAETLGKEIRLVVVARTVATVPQQGWETGKVAED